MKLKFCKHLPTFKGVPMAAMLVFIKRVFENYYFETTVVPIYSYKAVTSHATFYQWAYLNFF